MNLSFMIAIFAWIQKISIYYTFSKLTECLIPISMVLKIVSYSYTDSR